MNIQEHGIEIIHQYVSCSDVNSIKSEVDSSSEEHPRNGIRNPEKKFHSINQLASSNQFISLATNILGSSPKIVRVIFFDKTSDKNWRVTWHQDKQ